MKFLILSSDWPAVCRRTKVINIIETLRDLRASERENYLSLYPCADDLQKRAFNPAVNALRAHGQREPSKQALLGWCFGWFAGWTKHHEFITCDRWEGCRQSKLHSVSSSVCRQSHNFGIAEKSSPHLKARGRERTHYGQCEEWPTQSRAPLSRHLSRLGDFPLSEWRDPSEGSVCALSRDFWQQPYLIL